ncbi:MAG: N-acetylneuraminate synthase [Dehalococcoidales bacterium]
MKSSGNKKLERVRIGDRLVGEGEPCLIIAEVGVNHNGDVTLARKLIDVAKDTGADAVKFQTFDAEALVTRNASKAGYQKETTGAEESQFDMLKRLELTEDDFIGLFDYAREQGLVFLSSAFDNGSVELLNRLGVIAFKVPSGEITNFPLLKYIARKKKPVILSTGMSTMSEVEEALEIFRNDGLTDIILLHCVTSYPAEVEEINLKAMTTLRNAFDLPVGLSDHTLGITVPIAAVAMGACIIEKHFTLDKSLPGPDQRASLEPQELKEMVKAIRDVEEALGDGVKRPTEEEEENKLAARRSIVARMDIPEGTIITEEMLTVKRPGTGLEPKYLEKIVGKVAREAIEQGESVALSKVGDKI